ncbi:MAG: hypothetical protein ACRCU1_03455 [Alsobacter sp.]
MAEYILPAPWDEDGEFWDRIEINAVEWPGKATVDVVRANKWDTKKAKGKHGGEREFNGADLAKVKIQIVCWTTEQILALVDLLPVIEPTPGKEKPDAVSITHPVAIIRKCLTITIDNLASKVTDKMMVVDIDATEHRPPEAKNASGTASGKGGSGFNPQNTGNCDDLAFLYNNLVGQLITLKSESDTLQFKIEVGEYDPSGWIGPNLAALQGQKAIVDANRDQLASELLNVQNQRQSLNCFAQLPSSDSDTTQP